MIRTASRRDPPSAARPWTLEQRAILASTAPVLAIRAFAGAGKTSTLREYARRRPRLRFLYLVFGKENQREAGNSFPRNVTAQTTHALAFAVVGQRFRHKLGEVKPIQVSRRYRVPAIFARAALGLVARFCNSGLPTIADGAAPLRGPLEKAVLPLAERLWADMTDPECAAVPITHDGYLKVFDLEGHLVDGCDVILVDEGQDLNAITISIIRRQRTAADVGVVIVGDTHQRIYGFRGARDAMAAFGGQTLSLTGSFRFGQGIADVANAILRLKDEPMRLTGCAGPSEVLRTAPEGRYAFLSRSNAGALVHASQNPDVPLHFVGGLDKYRVERIRDAHAISEGRTRDVRDPEFRNFSSLALLSRYAYDVGDVEIQGIVFFVKQFGSLVPEILEDLASRHVDDRSRADLVLATAHKAKGLEFDTVALGPFIDLSKFLPETRERLTARWEAELCLLYVAATRARRRLFLNAELVAITQGNVARPGWGPRTAARSLAAAADPREPARAVRPR